MNFNFTLLCFVKCFNLTYSRSATSDYHLKMFFNGINGFDDYINGKTDPVLALKINIKMLDSSDDLVDYFSKETVRNVYTHIIGEPNNRDIPNMLFDLLSYACGISKEFQKEIYNQRRSEEFVNYITELKSTCIQATENKIETLDVIDLIEKAISNDLGIGNLKSIDMAFHCGSEWRCTINGHQLLMILRSKGISIRVLINSSAEIGNFSSHIKSSQIELLEVDKCVQAWKKFASEYPDFIELKVAKVPLFRSIYFLRGEEKGIARIKGYCYGNCIHDITPDFYYEDSEKFEMYSKEYEYIWGISE